MLGDTDDAVGCIDRPLSRALLLRERKDSIERRAVSAGKKC